MRRQELGWTKARAKPAESGNALPRVVDNGDPRAKVRHIAAHRLHGAEFADVADRALAGWHEQAASMPSSSFGWSKTARIKPTNRASRRGVPSHVWLNVPFRFPSCAKWHPEGTLGRTRLCVR